MLEIFILFKVGQAINRKAASKGWPGWPFVLILVFLYLGGGIVGVIAMVILAGDPNPNGQDDLLDTVIGFYAGAVSGAIASYLLALPLPDRSEPEDEDDRPRRRRDRDDENDDDRPRRRRDRGIDDEDDRDVPRARRADDEDEWRRR